MKFHYSWHLLLSSLFVYTMSYSQEVYRAKGNTIEVTTDQNIYVCKLSIKPLYARLSHDRSALILSQRDYVRVDQLMNCRSNETVVVSSVPDQIGFLSDINLAKGIYISLDLIAVAPASYLATVARIGTKRNLVTLNGAYLAGKSLKYLSKYGFGSDGEVGASIISHDGHFVAPNGTINCAVDAYPGVWNIRLNKRMITDDSTCEGLFLTK